MSEIHYHPAQLTSETQEFIELYNSSPIRVDLSGWKLRGDVDYEIPQGTHLAGGEFLIIARDPTEYQDLPITVLGPWTGELPNDGGRVRLRKASGGIVLETNYEDNSRWPLAADGAGHSLVLKYPSFGESRREAWAASHAPGGSPGAFDPIPTTPLDQIVISEVLSHSSADQSDFIELHNPSTTPVDLGGCFLTLNPELPGYPIPDGTAIPAGGYLHFPADITGLELEISGNDLFFRAPDGQRVITGRQVTGQAEGRSWGGLTKWAERQAPTPGAANADIFHDSLVINEIHYHPVGGTDEGEFIELLNRGNTAIDLSGWQLKDGIGFTFPDMTVIAPNDFLVIAKDRAALLTLNPQANPGKVIGDYSGSLSNQGERIALEDLNNRTVDEVRYFDGGRWPSEADGGGASLQLIDARADNLAPANWHAADESQGQNFVTIEHTGVLDFGHKAVPEASRFFIMLHGEGEAIIDDVEVIVDGTNRVSNASFDGGLSGWQLFGTHSPTFAENGAMHLVATDEGDLANLVETTLSSSIPPGTTVTLRARARWVSGNPHLLLGLNGGYLEAPGTLPVPTAVGTPAGENDDAQNIGPAITEVRHFPLLPQPGEPITIEARISDPDDILTARVRYRIDPSSSLAQLTMTDVGDGIFRATIPAQPAGTMIAFHLIAADDAAARQTSSFPEDPSERECLIRVGSANEPGDFSTMHLWTTDATLSEWRFRPRSSNLELDATFVSENRVIYNVGTYYAGSQNGVTIYDSPVGNPTGYNIKLPDDQVFLNVQNLTIDRETTRDVTRQRERLLFWFLEKLKLPNLHRRYVHFYFNGVERDQLIMESVQKPNREIISQWFGDEGRLTKTAPWWEFNTNSDVLSSGGPERNSLSNQVSADGSIKIPPHRWTWTHGSGHDDGNDFSGILGLIEAAQAPDESLVTSMTAKANMRQWMRTFAMNDLGSYWDTFGNPGSKNAYLHESQQTGEWNIVIWDMDVGLGVFNDPVNAPLFAPNIDPAVQRLYDEPTFARHYWNALEESLSTFFDASAGTEAHDILTETYQALLANGAAVASPFNATGSPPLPIDDWINQRRSFIQSQLGNKNAGFMVSGPESSDERFVEISGTLPLATTTLTANGIPVAVAFSTITDFTARIPLQSGANAVLLEAENADGHPIGSDVLNITFTGSAEWPALTINEWMAANPATTGFLDPADEKADDWIELYNPTDEAVSLDGWFLSDDPTDPLQFPIPTGFSIPAKGFILVWADNEPLQNAPETRQQIHTNFRLSSAGESIILTAPDGFEVDRVDFTEQTPGIALARAQDGVAQLRYTLTPTPNITNGTPPLRSPVIAQLTSESLVFPSSLDEVYEIQDSTDLSQWKPIAPPARGTGSTLSVTIERRTPRHFYRVINH